jgi:hypothetical protein
VIYCLEERGPFPKLMLALDMEKDGILRRDPPREISLKMLLLKNLRPFWVQLI